MDSPNGPVLPYLRSIDGFNTHDDAFQLAIAGGNDDASEFSDRLSLFNF